MKRTEKAGRTGQEDSPGILKGNSFTDVALLRCDVRLQNGVGAQVDGRSLLVRFPAVPFTLLSGFDSGAHLRYRGAFQELAHRQANTEGSIDAAQELRRGEGVAADVEEVVVGVHVALFQAQYVLPDPDEQVLLLVPRRTRGERLRTPRRVEGRRGDAGRRRWELFSIDLAGGVLQWQVLQLHKDRRDRVVWEALLQATPDLRATARSRVYIPSGVTITVLRGIGSRYQVGDETFILPFFALGDHDAVPERELFLDRSLDRSKLDAEPTDLRHEIDAPEDLQAPVGQSASLVTGTVHSGPSLRGEGVFEKALRRALGKVHITARQEIPPNVNLSGRSGRHGLLLLIEDIEMVWVHGKPHGAMRRRRVVDELSHVARGHLVSLADAVAVEHARRGQKPQSAPRQRLGDHLPVEPQHPQVPEPLTYVGSTRTEHRLKQGGSHYC